MSEELRAAAMRLLGDTSDGSWSVYPPTKTPDAKRVASAYLSDLDVRESQQLEIERLRTLVDGYAAGFDAQHEEIVRLRKALTDIIEHQESVGGGLAPYSATVCIAQKALG